ncbi:SRPBCC domain-containing protein [Luteolibacter pohnpeiensis]|uniref:SRPBCC domain-containing protein n=1 Tax=Luteolibacter pohnpeiensis TaxID=454153 RepID=A0A934S3T0_9BACT|nr:SRPBCC domain-containing protein [Luteolibacter pohnpeiensis]MBK1881966.1 SRPBCC domain-containing protein [Luteolibacter pohnpeiensis]
MSIFEHHIEVPVTPAEVFGAFEDSEKYATWWGPDGFSNTFEIFEFRTGGKWKYIMHGPDGRDYPNESEFVEIIPDARVHIRHTSLPRYDLKISLDRTECGTLVSWHAVFENETFAEKMRDFLEGANEQNLRRLAGVVTPSI